MTIWWLAAGLLAVTGVYLAWPLLRSGSLALLGAAVLLTVPAVGLLVYQQVGSPTAIDARAVAEQATEAGDMPAMLVELEARLLEAENDPQALQGWLLLGRSHKNVQQYDEARRVLEMAAERFPDDPDLMVELAEARLFTSGSPRMAPRERDLLQRALEIEPDQQKGLWLLGLAAEQDGDDATALDYWARLMTRLEPGGNVASAVRQRMNTARARLGEPVAGGISVRVEDGGIPAGLAESATLFIIARAPGGGGPPAAVRRIDQPRLPIEVVLSDADSIMPGQRLSSLSEVELTARLSLAGQAQLQPGDWTSTPLTLAQNDLDVDDAADPVRLVVDERHP